MDSIPIRANSFLFLVWFSLPWRVSAIFFLILTLPHSIAFLVLLSNASLLPYCHNHNDENKKGTHSHANWKDKKSKHRNVPKPLPAIDGTRSSVRNVASRAKTAICKWAMFCLRSLSRSWERAGSNAPSSRVENSNSPSEENVSLEASSLTHQLLASNVFQRL